MCPLHFKVMTYNSPFLKSGVLVVTFFNKYIIEKDQEKKSNFTVERPDKHHPSQVIKVHMNILKVCNPDMTSYNNNIGTFSQNT